MNSVGATPGFALKGDGHGFIPVGGQAMRAFVAHISPMHHRVVHLRLSRKVVGQRQCSDGPADRPLAKVESEPSAELGNTSGGLEPFKDRDIAGDQAVCGILLNFSKDRSAKILKMSLKRRHLLLIKLAPTN